MDTTREQAGPGTQAFSGKRVLPWTAPGGLESVLARWRQDGRIAPNLLLDTELPARAPRTVPLPDTLTPQVRDALIRRGLAGLYTHQAQAVALAHAGRDVVVATPTASGKSLCYTLPVVDRLAREKDARALYLFPTKALSRDQEASLGTLMRDVGLTHGAITFDGDTPQDARRAARERSGVVLSNPDMLHTGILPHHASWSRLFSNLRFVVLDELHMYRGVFGSHLANVLRRLQRVAQFHGSTPQFLFASATIGNPQEHASRLLGREVALVDENGAPSGARRVLVYNPPVLNPELGIRQSMVKVTARLSADLVKGGVTTLVFGQSRNTVEVLLKYLRDALVEAKVDPKSLLAYRGGYLPQARRDIEKRLREGAIRCVVATNALELGIDIGALDAVVCAGYPGSLAALWQRFGRAGRRQGPSLALLVASSAPMDQYVVTQKGALLGAPVEQARIDPDNPEILVQHLKCAAFELPFEEGEGFRELDADSTQGALDFLASHRVLHPGTAPSGARTWHWSADAYPANNVSLRSIGWDNVVIIQQPQDSTLAELDWRSAHTMLHEQAIYQHDGEQYQVEKLDLENRKAFVRKVAPDYFTDAHKHTRVEVLVEDAAAAEPHAHFGLGEVSVVEKVVGFKKVKFHTHENVGYGEVALPELQMHTAAFWLTVPEAVVASLHAPRVEVVDAVRALSVALHAVACVGLMVDPRDLGRTVGGRGLPGAPPHLAKGALAEENPTVFLYDEVPGGVGLASRLFEERHALLQRARQALDGCGCESGCPACIGIDIGLAQGLGPRRKHLVQALFDALDVPAVH